MNDYERIALVIRRLDECHTEQPDLAALADYLDLSPYDFRRLFSSWAAVTPKGFLQCLTLAHARALLKAGESVLDAGLSGPGRLHDLCVKLEAASPGELKRGGEGWTITAGFAQTPFGKCVVGESPRGIFHLAFVDSVSGETEWDALVGNWPRARFQRDDAYAGGLAGRIFEWPAKTDSRPMLRVYVRGTAFQLRVWRALLRVQPGTLVSYGQLARSLGRPSAARAVGAAVGRNSLAYLVPCHRVIRETGVIGQYRWGRTRKRAMHAWENAARTHLLGTVAPCHTSADAGSQFSRGH